MLLNYGFAIDENPFSAIEIDILELNDAFYNLFRLGIPWTVNPLPGRSGTVHEMIYFEFSVWIRNISWQNSMRGNMMQMWLTSENTLIQNSKFSMIEFHSKWMIFSLTSLQDHLIFFILTQESGQKTNITISQLKSRFKATRLVVTICSTLKP